MAAREPSEITRLLRQWNAGDAAALEQLKPWVDDELQRLAESFLQNERPGHTLGATALAHETYLKLIDEREVHWRDHAHFFEEAANIMRRLLVDDARKSEHSDVLALEQALAKLASIDKRMAQELEMKFFGGLTSEEIAEVLPVSGATIERD